MYAEPDAAGTRSAESSSQDGQSLGKDGSEDGEASAMDEDERPQPRRVIRRASAVVELQLVTQL